MYILFIYFSYFHENCCIFSPYFMRIVVYFHYPICTYLLFIYFLLTFMIVVLYFIYLFFLLTLMRVIVYFHVSVDGIGILKVGSEPQDRTVFVLGGKFEHEWATFDYHIDRYVQYRVSWKVFFYLYRYLSKTINLLIINCLA